MKYTRPICVKVLVCVMCCFPAIAGVTQDNGRDTPKQHHHYKLIDVGTFPGRSIYNLRISSNGSTATEFLQVLNNRGMLVGGADTSIVNPFPNCFNPFNQVVECYVQHAFLWQQGRLIDLGTLPGGSASFAFVVSDNGLVAGGSEDGNLDPNNGNSEFHAVLWNGSMIDLGTLGGSSSLSTGVNNAGQVVGFAQNTISDPFSLLGPGTQTRAFLWQNGKTHDLHTLGGPDSFAQYVNNAGQIAGVSYTSDIPDPNTGLPPLHPFLWEKGKMKDLGTLGGTNGFLGPFLFGLNNLGEVVGVMALTGDQFIHAFLWDGTKLIDLHNWTGNLGGDFSQPAGLNDAGDVVGFEFLPDDQLKHAVLWKDGTTTDLGTLHGDPCSVAEAINSSGQIVGASQSAAGGCNFFTSAFLWENGGPSVDLNDLVPAHSSLFLTGAAWINDRGEIVSRGVPTGCGDVDICGHAALILPCDENHPDVEGCDYNMMDASTIAEAVVPFHPQGATISRQARTGFPTGSNAQLRFGQHPAMWNRGRRVQTGMATFDSRPESSIPEEECRGAAVVVGRSLDQPLEPAFPLTNCNGRFFSH
jgi:probable HAF family extracellular repeat protein